jgi:hypothetical protein
MLTPTVGIPQTVAASRRPKNMSQREFYTLGSQQNRTAAPQQPPDQNYQVPQTQQDQQFEQDPISGDYIQEQLARFNNRTAPPMLEPGARVKSANAELVQPSSFQVYYEQLNTIGDIADNQLGAASARAAFQRAQSAQQLPLGYGGTTSTGSGKSLQKGGNAYGNAIPSNPAANFKYAQNIAGQFGWNAQELQAWYTLGMKESGWRNTAQNPTSTAFGIGQFLDSTWKGVGMSKTSDPQQQVLAMAKYIKNRYGSPSKALAFHISHNWY